MKVQKFLIFVKNHLVNYPDVSLKTVKMFMDKFKSCLSEKETERHKLELQVVNELTSKQITIDSIVHNAKVEHYENQLNGIKKKDKNE